VLCGHVRSGLYWSLLAGGGAASHPCAYVGARLTVLLDERALLRVCAAVLVVSGLSMLVQAIVG